MKKVDWIYILEDVALSMSERITKQIINLGRINPNTQEFILPPIMYYDTKEIIANWLLSFVKLLEITDLRTISKERFEEIEKEVRKILSS